MSRRSLRRPRLAAALAVAGLGFAMGAPGGRAAAPPPSANLLDHERVDVAVLAATGPGGAPRILVVDPTEPGDASVRLAVLSRDADRVWAIVTVASVAIPAGGVAEGWPWLVGIGDDRFALLVPTAADERTVAIGIQVRAAGEGVTIEEGRQVEFDTIVDDGGAADVDGDGSLEYVFASARTIRQGATCQGSRLWIVDPSLATVREVDVPDRRLAAGVIGRFDVEPGDDLAVYANPNCPAGPDFLPEVRLVAVRLTDGTIIADRPVAGAGDVPWVEPPPPVLLPMGGDLDALLAHVPRGVAVIDPHDDWADIRVATRGALPLGAVAASPRGSDGEAIRVAWLEPSIDGRGSIGTEVVRRAADRSLDSGPATVMWSPDEASPRWSAVVARAIADTSRQVGPVGWLGALGSDDCHDLVMPTAIVRCADGSLIGGPAWISTRPLHGFATSDGPRLLTAVSMRRLPGDTLPATPSPWAGGPPGQWRHGPSLPFALAELDAADAQSDAAVERPTIDRDAIVGPAARLAAGTGTRLIVTATGLSPSAIDPDPDPDLGALLATGPRDPGIITVTRVPVMPAAVSGSNSGVVELGLETVTLLDGTPAERWSVSAVPLDDRGELGTSAGGAVRLDVAAPAVDVEVPSVTPIWPVAARLTGATEPGAAVRVGGGTEVDVAADGTFVIETPLAPWPQTVVVTATDAFGNQEERVVTVVGGFDYRTLPWAAILAFAVITGVIVSGVIGTRRRRGPMDAGHGRGRSWDDGPAPELEELPPGGGLGTDR